MLRNRLLAPSIVLSLALATPAASTVVAPPTPLKVETIATVKTTPQKHRRFICRKKPEGRIICHSQKWWKLAAAYASLLHQAEQRAAFTAWIEAISFPPAHLVPIMNCIKDHESGNYAESSHPSSGSGAYQYTPGTWLTYFLRWRDSLPADHQYKNSYYALAFLAPAYVQDRVIVYTLENGGAHNWDPAYGDDPCTVGM